MEQRTEMTFGNFKTIFQ